MFKQLKELLLQQIKAICDLLEHYEFCHIRYISSRQEIRFARDEAGGQNISIPLERNDNLIVIDYVFSTKEDIFAFIMRMRNATLSEILEVTKQILRLDSDWMPRQTMALFGGIFDGITNSSDEMQPEIDKSILEEYKKIYTLRFLKDGISFKSHDFWGDMYDVESQRIIIPIYDEYGRLVGIKGRRNYETESELEPKYLYLAPVSMSQVLYGYCQNYQYLYGSDVIIVESEKAVQQAYSFGVRNIVGLGSNNLSFKHATLVAQLSPQRVIMALDEGLDFEQTKKNIETLKGVFTYMECEFWYWDSTKDPTIPKKASPTDMGYEKFKDIMDNQLVKLEEVVIA